MNAIPHTTPAGFDQVVMEFSRDGGIEAVAFELQSAFRAAGVDSRIITSTAQDAGPDVVRIAPLLSSIGTRGRWRHIGRAMAVPAFTIAATRFLRQAHRRGEGRVVISHGDTLAGDICVVHSVNRANLDMKRATGSWQWRLNPMHYWVSMRDRMMIGGRRFRRYVALSERVVADLQHYYGLPAERIARIPNGVNLDHFSPAPKDRLATRDGLGIPAEVDLLLFVGHEFERKGLVHVIDALAALNDRTTRLLVVGAGRAAAFEHQARSLGVADRVTFTGPRQDMPQLYRAADAFVFPTGYESFSLTCMEALACGLPVFATAVGGIEDYLIDGVNGRVIQPNGAMIAAALATMLSDPGQRQRFRQAALATAANYAWPRIAEQYCALVEEVRQEIASDRLDRNQSTISIPRSVTASAKGGRDDGRKSFR